METAALQILNETGLLRRRGVAQERVNSLSASQIFEIAAAVVESTRTGQVELDRSVFRHSASRSLAGGRSECGYLRCRSERVESLARFALMYSDTVYVPNPLLGYEGRLSRFRSEQLQHLRQDFYEDLCLIQKLGPVVESGHAVLFTPSHMYHRSCLAEASFGAGAGKKLDHAQAQLARDFLSHTKVTVSYDPRYRVYEFSLNGPELYYDHGGLVFQRSLHRGSKLSLAVQRRGDFRLPNTEAKRLGFHEDLAQEVVSNVCNHLLMSRELNSVFLTEKDIHVNFLRLLSADTELERRNSVALRHLTSLVPFAEDVAIESLVKLRRDEQEAFVSYRSALNKAIQTFASERGAFTEKDARALYSDVIAPRLASLDSSVKKAKRQLVANTYRPILGWVGAISFGIYTGLIPSHLAGLATAVGFTQAASNILQNLMSVQDSEREAIPHELYFLWKVRRMAKQQPRKTVA